MLAFEKKHLAVACADPSTIMAIATNRPALSQGLNPMRDVLPTAISAPIGANNQML